MHPGFTAPKSGSGVICYLPQGIPEQKPAEKESVSKKALSILQLARRKFLQVMGEVIPPVVPPVQPLRTVQVECVSAKGKDLPKIFEGLQSKGYQVVHTLSGLRPDEAAKLESDLRGPYPWKNVHHLRSQFESQYILTTHSYVSTDEDPPEQYSSIYDND